MLGRVLPKTRRRLYSRRVLAKTALGVPFRAGVVLGKTRPKGTPAHPTPGVL